MWKDFAGPALAYGNFIGAPPTEVVGHASAEGQ